MPLARLLSTCPLLPPFHHIDVLFGGLGDLGTSSGTSTSYFFFVAAVACRCRSSIRLRATPTETATPQYNSGGCCIARLPSPRLTRLRGLWEESFPFLALSILVQSKVGFMAKYSIVKNELRTLMEKTRDCQDRCCKLCRIKLKRSTSKNL